MYGRIHYPNTDDDGLFTTAIKYLLRRSNIYVNFVEFYDGMWIDLCDGRSYDKFKDQFQKIKIDSVDDAMTVIKKGLINRKTNATNQNQFSSRSHAMIILSSTHSAKMVFVDMAGNECLDGKENVNETCAINKSLSQFNTVLSYQVKGQMAPPYRNNPFTHFLQPYLQKNKSVVFYFARKNYIARDLFAIQDIIEIKKPKK